MLKMRIATLNVRSIRSKDRLLKVNQMFNEREDDVMVITETIHNRQLLMDGLNLIHTTPEDRKGCGVAILSKRSWKLTPLFKQFWTDCTCVAMVSQ